MAEMSKYCKAYELSTLSQFSNWKIKEDILLKTLSNSEATDAKPETPEESHYLFLHDNFHVTTGIYPDEDVAFDDITPEWIEFCKSTLGFAPPAAARQQSL